MTDYTEPSDKPKKSLLSRIITIVLPLALGAIIVYFLLRDMDLNAMWETLKDANWVFLLLSLPFVILGHSIRGFRWGLLMKPLGYNPSRKRLIFSILGGYAINYGIPRAGEVWRCGIVAKDEKVPFTTLLGTMLLDRVFDTITVALIVLAAVGFNANFFIEQLRHNQETFDSFVAAIKSPTPYIIIVLVIAIIYITFKYFDENKFVAKIKEALKGMGNDMRAIWKMKEKGWLLLYTLGIWVSYFCFFYTTFFAFGFTENLGITAGLIGFALSSLSMGIPTNGGLGPWQVAVIASLMLYGVDEFFAKSFAMGVFMVQSFWQIIVGLASIGILAFMKKRDTPPLIEK